MEKLSILIADKSIFYKKIFSLAVDSTGMGTVKQLASDANLALEKLRHSKADVLLIDMPTKDIKTISAIENIRRENPGIYIVIMIPEPGGRVSKLRELTGGLDFIIKPPVEKAEKNVEAIKNQLQTLFAQLMTGKYMQGGKTEKDFKPEHPCTNERKPLKKKKPDDIDLVAIASSTGGPSALEAVLKNIRADFNKPVLIVQHMPVELTKKLAQSLNKKCALNVIEAEEDSPVNPGVVLIAPGGAHMTVIPRNGAGIKIKLDSSLPVNGVKPSADVLFRSISKTCRGKNILVIILTGMGSDGMLGVKDLKENCKCYCIAQNESTSVVYGMPKSVVDAGLSDTIESLEAIPQILNMYIGRST